MTRRLRLALLAAALGAAGLGGAAWRFWWRGHGPDDPRLNYAGPFRNVHPAVGYAGDARCQNCHPQESEGYRDHPMARSLGRVRGGGGDLPAVEGRNNNPFAALGVTFAVRHEGPALAVEQRAGGRPAGKHELHYALGSGTHGVSFLTDRGGRLFQSPVSWYAQKRIWDRSPGFTEVHRGGRPIEPDCLFCHASRAEHVPGTVNGYAGLGTSRGGREGLAIGCERCHGPASLHLDSPGTPNAIVNPSRLPQEARDAVCEQCHLAGEARAARPGREAADFRPGLHLSDFVTVFVGGDSGRAVNHVEQMRLSRCFAATDGTADRLGCVSCHDPHRHAPAPERTAGYRRACLKCHADRGCSAPPERRRATSPEDSCVACHMARYQAGDIPHTASTDHRILRTPRPPEGAGAGQGRLRAFYPLPEGAEADRARGLAQVAWALKQGPQAARHLADALPLLESALERYPDDLPVRATRGWALSSLGRQAEALAALQAALEKSPRHERTLTLAALAAQDLGRGEAALEYWSRAIDIDPHAAPYRAARAHLLAAAGRWAEVPAECDAWLELDPGNSAALALRGEASRRGGARAP